IAALILCLTIGIEYSAAGAISFSIGSMNLSLSGLAIASIVGIVLNAILPGQDDRFADKPKDSATLGRY
ncbi:MAG: uracil-xanthine permease, partial [Eubacterium sp.]|nr:uracil-xanthine permease [Eubacterium sp.]